MSQWHREQGPDFNRKRTRTRSDHGREEEEDALTMGHKRRSTMHAMQRDGAGKAGNGDIVSLLAVLVHHGFYSKQNLNSVQQLAQICR